MARCVTGSFAILRSKGSISADIISAVALPAEGRAASGGGEGDDEEEGAAEEFAAPAPSL
jgi:hypothetical protein